MKDNNINNSKDVLTLHDEEISCLKERLTRCLQLLKITYDNQISKTAFKLIERATLEQTKTHGQWIAALNAIAGSCILNQRIFSQSEVYDFLTVAVSTNIEEKGRTKAIDDIIFRIYTDIMTNYQSSDDTLKIAYPKIIVDVIAILVKGVDAGGKKIPTHNIEGYYQMRKLDASTSSSAAVAATTTTTTTAATSTSATAASIDTIKKNEKKEEEAVSSSLPKSKPSSTNSKKYRIHIILSEDEKSEIIESLKKITDRGKKDLEISLSKLQRTDVARIKDLCKNYSKLQKYSKLTIDSGGSEQQQRFKAALEKDIGRKLSDYQLQHASNSIRKARLYIENVLDGKFVPHGSYGINHTKHNLEYGYLIVGLMQPSRKRRT